MSYWKITFLDSESAVKSGMENIFFDIPRRRRADIYCGMIIKIWSCLFLNGLYSLKRCSIRISFIFTYFHNQSFI